MKMKLLVGAVVVALAAVGGLYLLPAKSVEKVAASAPAVTEKLVSVACAAGDLAQGSFLSARDLSWKEVTEKAAKGAFIEKDAAELTGSLVVKPVKAGEVIGHAALLARTDPEFLAAVLAPGMRAFTIEVDAVTGGAGLLRPGNRVDVILAAQTDPQKGRTFTGPKNFDVARTLLENLRVIAVDRTIEPKGFGGDPANADPRAAARPAQPQNVNRKGTVTLEVTPKDVELLTVARSNGQLSLSLRNSQAGEAPAALSAHELTKLAEVIPPRPVQKEGAAVEVKTFYGASTEPPQQ